MSSILLVDDAVGFAELLARTVSERTGHEVVPVSDPALVDDAFLGVHAFDLALVDLSFPHSPLSGLDVLVALDRGDPRVRLVVLTQGDDWVADLLRDAWEALPLATALSKTSPVDVIVATVETVLREGTAPVDPVLAPLLPRERSPWRRASEYGRLVRHAGHAKLWRALAESAEEPSYQALREATGLTVNTLRNYRDQLLPDLALHDLENPSLREMHAFARRVGPLLGPFISRKLG